MGRLGSGVLAGRADGYPARILDKRTGVIDKKVAEYWRENYDLMDILRRDWNKGLGKKLEGKLNIYVGDMDNYYLNNAVYLVEEFLSRRRRIRTSTARSITAIAPSTAGTATTRGRTRCRACAITRCSSRGRRAHTQDRAAGRGREELEVLTCRSH